MRSENLILELDILDYEEFINSSDLLFYSQDHSIRSRLKNKKKED